MSPSASTRPAPSRARRAAGRPSGGVRLQASMPAERQTLHPPHGPCAHDGGGAAVHLGRHIEDHQHARRVHCPGHHGRLYRELASGAEGSGHLSRQFQAHATAELGWEQRRQEDSQQLRHSPPRQKGSSTNRSGGNCRTRGNRSPTSSQSQATKVTSRWACTRTACPARCL